uniref:DNA methyltransferase n=1 Tax=Bifidobacterium longum TaxID=216816 RepID=UPI0021175698
GEMCDVKVCVVGEIVRLYATAPDAVVSTSLYSARRWLVRLVTPPDGLVLEPFAGSGATLEACRIEDVRCVAAEMDSDYVRLIARRMARPTNPVLF